MPHGRKEIKMEQKEIEGFRQFLLRKREEILNASIQNREAAVEFGRDAVPDVGDEGSISYNRMVLASLSEGEKRRVVEIDDALARIKNGTYGTCQSCGGPIGEKRLSVRPEAPYCVKCQGEMEGKR
jgi:DnaK suppressor protein